MWKTWECHETGTDERFASSVFLDLGVRLDLVDVDRLQRGRRRLRQLVVRRRQQLDHPERLMDADQSVRSQEEPLRNAVAAKSQRLGRKSAANCRKGFGVEIIS